jgi:MFS family permease
VNTQSASSDRAAAWVVLGGMVAALQVGKLPPALSALQADLGISLVQSGFLLSLVQMAGMMLAIFVGLAADGVGLKRSMVAGLSLLAAASFLGGLVGSAWALLSLRALEGLGFLLTVLPAPALIRRLSDPQRLAGMMGVWGTYMPVGTAVALLAGPLVIPVWGWPLWWEVFAVMSALTAWALHRRLPADPPPVAGQAPIRARQRLADTLGTPGPWLVALMFAVYSSQWLAVVGFLPSIYAQAGVAGALLGALTAGAAAINLTGNLASGRLLQRGWVPQRLLWVGFAAMALGSALAFGPSTEGWPWLRYTGVLLFSSLGGLVPGTLFWLAVRLAPGERQVASTVGWAQQWSALGQFFGPPVVAWVAARHGGWQFTPWVTGACCLAGAALAWLAGRQLRRRRPD